MRSINILEEISDGKLYDIEDIVKQIHVVVMDVMIVVVMLEIIVLTPFDVYEMVTYLGVEFDELVGQNIELRQNNKILLLYLKMMMITKTVAFK
ncbi:hypothetical protein Q5M85_21100 [Paraclostridium bifermentans]|nr:hypothetical protein [Paraclostridium bifermentans]